MNLVTLKDILSKTRKEKYAVGGFNFNGYEDAQGIVNGAVDKKSPVILMASMGAVSYIGIDQIAGMVKGMAKKLDIPVCLHLDHATDVALIKEAVELGFTSVMIDASAKSYEENIAITKSVVEYAKKFNCSVEAELGKIGGKEDNIEVDDESAFFTDPNDVERFVTETGIDALAVAVGTSHGFYKKAPKIDFDRLEKISKITDLPLVLHGGTGVPEEDIKRTIQIGMGKINIGTELKSAFSNAIRKATLDNPETEFDPRKYMTPVKVACAEIVRNKIDVCGSANKA